MRSSWDIFEDLNDWNIVQLDAKVESLCALEGKVGAFWTEDPDFDGCHLVEWSSAPQELQEARELTEHNPPILVPKGELVADATCFNKVPRAPRWHTQRQQCQLLRASNR